MKNDMLSRYICKILLIPQYLKTFQNISSFSDGSSSIPCPLPAHKEQKGKSFNFNAQTNKWSCYGKCNKRGKDVIELHKEFLGLQSYENALEDLRERLNVGDTIQFSKDLWMIEDTEFHEEDLRYRKAFLQATSLANRLNNIDIYLELDYLMSFFKPTKEITEDLKYFILKYK